MNEPASELYPGYAEDLKKREARHARIAEASAEPLPGPLLKAFTAAAVEVLGFTLRPVVHYDHVMLRRLNSPFHRNLRELGKPEAERKQHEANAEEVCEFIYLFLTPSRRGRDDLNKSRALFRQNAVLAANKIPQDDLIKLAAAIRDHFMESWATAIGYEGRTYDTVVYRAAAGDNDGLGWWLKYLARLMMAYPFARDYVLHDLPSLEGHAMLAAAIELDSALDIERSTPGYIAQHIDSLADQPSTQVSE